MRRTDLVRADLREADLREANFYEADLRAANLHDADSIIRWQSPCGEKRICISVKHKDCVMHKLGCFWGDTDQAVSAIRKKYGENSAYEKMCFLNAHALEVESRKSGAT